MYECGVVVQDPMGGRVGAVLAALTRVAEATAFDDFRGAIAYANEAGARELSEHLPSGKWAGSSKRWLISIDFGLTQPSALRFLSSLPNSEVRVPNGAEVVQRRGFAPTTGCFHPKFYAFSSNDSGLGLFVGSGNLTLSGLAAGVEAGTAQVWMAPLAEHERRSMSAAIEELRAFEIMWERADSLSSILVPYELRWRHRPRRMLEEETPAVELYSRRHDEEVVGEIAVLLRVASALWVETGDLYKNRGRALPGNQLDLPRGTRVFFGFPPDAVPRNRILGDIVVHCDGRAPVVRSVRFGNNLMDKVNLPVPGQDGPASYDNAVLLFERLSPDGETGLPSFRLSIVSRRQLARRRAGTRSRLFRMHGGREYGLLF